MKAEIITSFERDKKHYLLLEVEQEKRATVENGYFETTVTTPVSIRCPEIEDFKFKAWAKNDYVTLEVSCHDDQYKLKFKENSCADFEELELFNLDLHKGVPIVVYLKDLFICTKNGLLDFRITLWAKCRNADHKIGTITDSIKL